MAFEFDFTDNKKEEQEEQEEFNVCVTCETEFPIYLLQLYKNKYYCNLCFKNKKKEEKEIKEGKKIKEKENFDPQIIEKMIQEQVQKQFQLQKSEKIIDVQNFDSQFKQLELEQIKLKSQLEVITNIKEILTTNQKNISLHYINAKMVMDYVIEQLEKWLNIPIQSNIINFNTVSKQKLHIPNYYKLDAKIIKYLTFLVRIKRETSVFDIFNEIQVEINKTS
ncbi:MAG: hypothetical protein WC934_06915 [Acidithiobacillus sp.]|jgi:hypothetical protein|uniref:hypothetical protein n=1 Tax=Acidithiobacillus sp. TaxID=1872118 RepID=UPI00355FBE1A